MLLLVLIPLQACFALLHEYSEHDAGEGYTEAPTLHTHYVHDAAAQAAGDSHEGHGLEEARGGGEPAGDGFVHFHLAFAALVTIPVAMVAGQAATAIPIAPGIRFSVSPKRLERPPLRARA